MKKLFLSLSILNLLIISNIGLVACVKGVKARNTSNGNNSYDTSYNIVEIKEFNLNNFTVTDFQSFTESKISEAKNNIEGWNELRLIKEQIKEKILDTIFEQIVGNKTADSDELKALKEIQLQIIQIKTELINKNQQLKIVVEVDVWEKIERFFKATAFPNTNHRLIKGLAELGLNNVKKYYDHIKNNKTDFTIEYGDKTFYSYIENAKKALKEDNENNADFYKVHANVNSYLPIIVKDQLSSYIKKGVFKNREGHLKVHILCNIA